MSTREIVILAGGEVHCVPGHVAGGSVFLHPDDHGRVLGWERKPQGWCRGDVCLPAFATAAHEDAGAISLAGLASLTGRLAVEDPAEAIAALVDAPADIAAGVRGGDALRFSLPDRRGEPFDLTDLLGHMVLLVFWASWCGCRYDLAAWEAEYRSLAPAGLRLVSIALDPDPGDAYEFIDAADATHVALVDAHAMSAARFDVINVPTVVWIDERGAIARPPDTQTATDAMRQFNGLDSAAALAALRHWVATGETGLTPADLQRHQRTPTLAGQQARAHAALGLHLLEHGRRDAGERHLDRAAQLAPHDVAIRRGTMRARGIEPFGQDYFDLRDELAAAGIEIYRPLPDWHRGG